MNVDKEEIEDELYSGLRVPRTELVKKLIEKRKQIIASGAPLLDRVALENEITERRGGIESLRR